MPKPLGHSHPKMGSRKGLVGRVDPSRIKVL